MSKKPDVWRVRWLKGDKPTHEDKKHEGDATKLYLKLKDLEARGVAMFPISYERSDFALRRVKVCC